MKKCKQGYYYCYKEEKCKRIPLAHTAKLKEQLIAENNAMLARWPVYRPDRAW